MLRPIYILVFCAPLLWANPTADELNARPQRFEAEKEFPNLFVPKELRGRTLDSLSESEKTILSQRRALVEKALVSVLERSTVPFLDPDTKKPRQERFFTRVRKEIEDVEQGLREEALKKLQETQKSATLKDVPKFKTKLVPSGGVVRSAYGYIYDQMYRAAQEGRDPDDVLNDLIRSNEDLPGYLIRGVGSDFDVLLKGLESRDHFDAIDARIKQRVHEVETAYELEKSLRNEQGFKRSLLTIVDAKPIDDIGKGQRFIQGQIPRSVQGGGINIDWLYLDMENKKLVEPAQMADPNAPDHIVDRLILGSYSYLRGAPENADKQTIRGIRPRFELPFLVMDEMGDSNLRQDLQALYSGMKAKDDDAKFDDSMLDQIEKTLRNARYGLAHNRIYRNPGGRDKVDALIKSISTDIDVFRKNARGVAEPALPPYADAFPLHEKSFRQGKELPSEVLIDQTDFIKHHLPEGVLNHGTPSLAATLSILRGGLRQSAYREGIARGAFTSQHESWAARFAGDEGAILKLRLREDVKIKIFDATKASASLMLQIDTEAAELGIEAADLLAQKYGVDLIKLNDNEILVKNTEVLQESHLTDLVDAYRSIAMNPNNSRRNRFFAFLNLRRIAPLAQDLENRQLEPLPELDTFIRDVLRGSKDRPAEVYRWMNATQRDKAASLWEEAPILKELTHRYLDRFTRAVEREIARPSKERNPVKIARAIRDYAVSSIAFEINGKHPQEYALQALKTAPDYAAQAKALRENRSFYSNQESFPHLRYRIDSQKRIRLEKSYSEFGKYFDDLLLRIQSGSFTFSDFDRKVLNDISNTHEGKEFVYALLLSTDKHDALLKKLMLNQGEDMINMLLYGLHNDMIIGSSNNNDKRLGPKIRKATRAFLKRNKTFANKLFLEEAEIQYPYHGIDFHSLGMETLDIHSPTDRALLRRYIKRARVVKEGAHFTDREDHLLRFVANQDPKLFFEEFGPDYRLPHGDFRVDRENAPRLTRFIKKTLARLEKGGTDSLSKAERSIVEHMSSGSRDDLERIAEVAQKNGAVRDLLFRTISRSSRIWRAGWLLSHERGPDDPPHPLSEDFDRYLKKRPNVRRQVLSYLILRRSSEELGRLPFDLSTKTDRDLLRGAFVDPVGKKRRFQTQIQKQFGKTHKTGDVRAEDAARNLYTEGKKDPAFISKGLAYKISHSDSLGLLVREKHPQFFVENGGQLHQRDKYSSTHHWIKDELKLWNQNGNLTRRAQTYLDHVARGPITNDMTGLFHFAIEQGGKAAEWAFGRLATSHPQDSFLSVIYSLEPVATTGMPRRYKDRLRNRIERFFFNTGADKIIRTNDWGGYDSLLHFPWDMKDPKDLALLKKLNRKFRTPPSDIRREYNIYRKSVDPHDQWSGHTDIERVDSTRLSPPAVAAEVKRRQAQYLLADKVEDVMKELFADAPKKFLREIGPAPSFIKQLSFSTDKKHTYWSKEFLPLAVRFANESIPLSRGDKRLLREYARKLNREDLAGLLRFPKTRETILNELIRSRPKLLLEFLDLSRTRSEAWGNWRKDAFKKDPNQVLRHERLIAKIVRRAIKENNWTDRLVRIPDLKGSDLATLKGLKLRVSEPTHQNLIGTLFRYFEETTERLSEYLHQAQANGKLEGVGLKDLVQRDPSDVEDYSMKREIAILNSPALRDLANLVVKLEKTRATTMRALNEKMGVSSKAAKCGLSLESLIQK